MTAPAAVSAAVAAAASAVAAAAVRSLPGAGIFGVELFQLPGGEVRHSTQRRCQCPASLAAMCLAQNAHSVLQACLAMPPLQRCEKLAAAVQNYMIRCGSIRYDTIRCCTMRHDI